MAVVKEMEIKIEGRIREGRIDSYKVRPHHESQFFSCDQPFSRKSWLSKILILTWSYFITRRLKNFFTIQQKLVYDSDNDGSRWRGRAAESQNIEWRSETLLQNLLYQWLTCLHQLLHFLLSCIQMNCKASVWSLIISTWQNHITKVLCTWYSVIMWSN